MTLFSGASLSPCIKVRLYIYCKNRAHFEAKICFHLPDNCCKSTAQFFGGPTCFSLPAGCEFCAMRPGTKAAGRRGSFCTMIMISFFWQHFPLVSHIWIHRLLRNVFKCSSSKRERTPPRQKFALWALVYTTFTSVCLFAATYCDVVGY